mgnify:CR=1 FL=1
MYIERVCRILNILEAPLGYVQILLTCSGAVVQAGCTSRAAGLAWASRSCRQAHERATSGCLDPSQSYLLVKPTSSLSWTVLLRRLVFLTLVSVRVTPTYATSRSAPTGRTRTAWQMVWAMAALWLESLAVRTQHAPALHQTWSCSPSRCAGGGGASIDSADVGVGD